MRIEKIDKNYWRYWFIHYPRILHIKKCLKTLFKSCSSYSLLVDIADRNYKISKVCYISFKCGHRIILEKEFSLNWGKRISIIFVHAPPQQDVLSNWLISEMIHPTETLTSTSKHGRPSSSRTVSSLNTLILSGKCH